MSAQHIRFGSVCSGIEAASVAWNPLGWQAAWLAEIEPFPCAVLAHHYPDVPNLGDMTTLPRRVLTGEACSVDVFCGGTPCQAFSVAGLRESLDDDRGNLTLRFVEIADAIDHVRARAGDPPCIVFWENVPGVLSTKDNAFGCFLAGLAGEDAPLQPPGEKWSNVGAVYGPARAVAWRTLDAQYFGVAQRRRRVFVVASARDGFDPATVLFEWDGVRRDTAPSREARQEPAGTLAGGARKRGGYSADDIPAVGYGGNNTAGPIDVATARNACASASGRMDFETETFLVEPARTLLGKHNSSHAADQETYIAHSLRGEDFDASEDGTGRGTPLVPVLPFDTTQVTSAANRSVPKYGAPCHPLAAGAHAPAIAFDCKASGQSGFGVGAVAPTLRAMGHAKSHQNGVGHQAVAYTTKLHNTASNNAGKIFEERTAALDANSPAPALLTAMQVRRLTPPECERLQGFPDNYTRIPTLSGWRKMDAGETPEQCRAEGLEIKQNKKTGAWRVKDVDGPRYKSLGNSWAIPNVRWIGRRIDAALRRLEGLAA